MLKMKHLFDHRDLAEMILANWPHDEHSREAMDHYRISANAVYPYYNDNALCFLRFAPVAEKPMGYVQGEMNFIRYLDSWNLGVVQTVPSIAGEALVAVDTPWGRYTACAFLGAGGSALSTLPYSHSLYYGFGQSLGKLHIASLDYQAQEPLRPGWRQCLAWCAQVFSAYDAPQTANLALSAVTECLSILPITPWNFGLIHYDYELDNVFFDSKTQGYCAIDFDDAHYHWFMMDMVKSMESIKEELPEEVGGLALQSFLSGYKSVAPVDAALWEQEDLFKGYANLVAYARILRSISEKWKTSLYGWPGSG